MLAYRHSFHAGNHADVLKHLVQVAVLRYFNEKEKPYWVIDTHAGAGMYSLLSGHARVKSEYLQGIAKLVSQPSLTPLIDDYLAQVRLHNPGELQQYPGSPAISTGLLRANDKLRLFELHPTDAVLLQELYQRSKTTTVTHADGFAGLKALLPPATRRAVVLIDPPYELKEDYHLVFDAIRDALQRFSQGTYVIWYPMLQRIEWRRMLERLRKLDVKWLNVYLSVAEPDAEGFGMTGSGVFVINPPWVLEAQLQEALPHLVRCLGQTSSARFDVDSFEPKVKK
jgi:23S rRNA (adenine2030-N6)-methyltransferase